MNLGRTAVNLERDIHEHFEQAARTLPDPPDRLAAVVRRGRRRRVVQGGLLAVAVLGMVLAGSTVLHTIGRARVDLAPAPANPGAVLPTEALDAGSDQARPSEARTVQRDVQAMPVDGLEGTVIAYVPGERGVNIHADGRVTHIWDGRADHALPDGRGGVLVQAGKTIIWAPEADPERADTLIELDSPPQLRGVGPDGRVRFSIRTRSPESGGEDVEEFFEMPLERGAQPESLGMEAAQESWTIGPAFVASAQTDAVHAACHLVCALRFGEFGASSDLDSVYDQSRTIDGLTSTRDGRVVAFVETQLMAPDEAMAPTLVLLDGRTLRAIARVELPRDPEAQRRWDEGDTVTPDAAIAADGQRVLVSIGRTYLVEGALTRDPTVRQIDFNGVLRWLE